MNSFEAVAADWFHRVYEIPRLCFTQDLLRHNQAYFDGQLNAFMQLGLIEFDDFQFWRST